MTARVRLGLTVTSLVTAALAALYREDTPQARRLLLKLLGELENDFLG